jgi:thiol-disulfide isomerase/thioredoxin
VLHWASSLWFNKHQWELVMPVVYFYRKDGCGLCDRMALELQAFRQRAAPGVHFDVEERDIEDSDHWYRRFREYVPVLVVDDEEVCHYFFDEQELIEALSCS